MVNLAQIGELQSVLGQMTALQTQISGLGDPSRLAGDPGAQRAAAGVHLDVASELRSALAQGGGQVARVAGSGAWDGPASGAFSGYWGQVRGQVEGLAGRHEQMAGTLQGIAGQTERLNGEVTGVLGAIDGWIAAAGAAIATLDVGAVPGLVSAAATLLGRWRTLLADLETFAGGLPSQMSIDLGPPGLPRILINVPAPQGPSILINVPGPALPGILINVPAPQGPTTLINVPGPKLPGILINVPGPQGPSIVTAKPGQPVPPPKNLPGFPGTTRVKPKTPVQGGGGMRARWKGPDGKIYEWDSQHGAVEVYDKRGKHLGEYDPNTGKQLKPPDPNRKVQP